MSYMEELDLWTHATVVSPLCEVLREYERVAHPDDEAERDAAVADVVAQVKKAIREKVLESYRNGQASRPSSESPKSRPPRTAAPRRDAQ